MNKILMVLTFSAAVCCSGCTTYSVNAKSNKGCRILEIVDGDTLIIQAPGAPPQTVSLYGIAVPALDEPFGWQAKTYLTKMVFGRRIDVSFVQVPDGAPNLVHAFVAGTYLNERLIDGGFAWIAPYETSGVFLDAEDDARRTGRGIWSDSRVMAPWKLQTARAAEAKRLSDKRSLVVRQEKGKAPPHLRTAACRDALFQYAPIKETLTACYLGGGFQGCRSEFQLFKQLAETHSYCLSDEYHKVLNQLGVPPY